MKYTSLEEIAKDHKDWLGIVSSWVDEYAEDIVQEMYIKVADKKEVNRSYIYLCLRSIFLNREYKKANMYKVDLDNCAELMQPIETQEREAYNKVFNKVIKESNTWSSFDRNLFLTYFLTKLSMRDIEDKAGISLSTVFETIQKCKRRIKDNVGEDWEDYCNKDYELL